MTIPYRRCTRCIMDTTDPAIGFDEQGRCNHCTRALALFAQRDAWQERRETTLAAVVERIKADGRGKSYDCVAGMSGGVDSSTLLLRAKQLGLRPLAVHFDNGWNSELAVDNIHQVLERLGIDLDTYVVEWEEFRDLQLAFLKASVPNVEVTTDHAIRAVLYRTAARFGLRHILTGGNMATEAILPGAWGHDHSDLRHLLALHRRFGTRPLKTLPTISLARYGWYTFVRGIRWVRLLDLTGYDREACKQELVREAGWREYGGKHYESVWTRFFQGYYLPRKFGFDKRLAHLSTLVISGMMTRDEALAAMGEPIYPPDLLEVDRVFVIKKFGVTEAEFEAIMAASPRRHDEYPTGDRMRGRLMTIKRRLTRGAW